VNVFIAGCPRSGSTWLMEMLAAHPDVYHVTGDDFAHWIQGKPGKESGCFQAEIGYSTALVKMVFAQVERENPNKTLVEKTPWHVMYLARLFHIFPDAKVILMKRDPRAVVASMLRKFPFSHVGDCTRFWIQTEQNALPYLDKCLVVQYEEMHADPAGTLQNVCDFTGLRPVPEIVNGSYDAELDIGTVDSWKKTLSPEQLDVVRSLLQREGIELQEAA